MSCFLGHSKNDHGKGMAEPLHIHLEGVAKRVSSFMEAWKMKSAGWITGMSHDLGKYADQMQRRLNDPSSVEGKNHTAAGASLIAHWYKNSLPLALSVLYHHGGLKKFYGSRKKLLDSIAEEFHENSDAYTDTDLKLLKNRLLSEISDIPNTQIPILLSGKIAADMLDVRMAASALDDADFIETEAHFAGDQVVPRRYRPEGAPLEAENALKAVFDYLETRTTENKVVRDVRQSLSSDCQKAGKKHLGTYFLTAPTGSGKTLSILLFALIHAKKHGLRRIVLVMPYLNIIDQTAKLYREIFSEGNGFTENYVLEDHSLAGFSGKDGENDLEDERQRTRKLLAENWDAPIVLTTSVKFFESLHASRNSQLRKLHRLAKSVVLFDEAQSLPPNLAALTLATLSRLSEPDNPYGSTVVFATATQPAFDSLSPVIDKFANRGWKPNSLIPDATVQFMFKSMANRVRVEWRDQNSIELEELAKELSEEPTIQVLCIMNLKRHARQLAELLAERLGRDVVYHLSTDMCSMHRNAVCGKVKERLDSGLPVLLIATQCIEAGVDISFPKVYRALAPLDSIAQAAGRCNRHGGETGTVVVFLPFDEKGFFPPGYKEGISTTRILLAKLRSRGVDPNAANLLNAPDFIQCYYNNFFELGNYTGDRNEQASLHEAVVAGDFEEVSKLYKLIPGDMINVLVPYDKEAFNQLTGEVRERIFMKVDEIRDWVAKAREHAVGLYRPNPDSMKWQALEPIQFGALQMFENHDADWFICLREAKYDSLYGLKLPDNFIGVC